MNECDTMPVRLGPDDIDELVELEGLCFPVTWTSEQFRRGLADNVIIAFGLREVGRLVAYMTFYASDDEAEILNIGVHPDFRTRGLGSRLMGLVLQICLKMGIKHMFLEVRESNTPARRLYDRHGFAQVGVRQEYYQDTKEDALVMRRDFA